MLRVTYLSSECLDTVTAHLILRPHKSTLSGIEA
jgi:hypothetical protein